MVDIVIIGGGLTGTMLMLALAQHNYNILLVDSQPESYDIVHNGNLDARSIALAPASIKILQQLDLWSRLVKYTNPITNIHISRKHAFGATRLHGTLNEPLGYLIDLHILNQKLRNLLPRHKILASAQLIAIDPLTHNLTVQTKTAIMSIKARLIVAADGTESTVRKLLH